MPVKFPFGKFNGVAVDNIPSWYLTWALSNLTDLDTALRDDMQRVLQQRKPVRKPAPQKPVSRKPVGKRQGQPSKPTPEAIQASIRLMKKGGA